MILKGCDTAVKQAEIEGTRFDGIHARKHKPRRRLSSLCSRTHREFRGLRFWLHTCLSVSDRKYRLIPGRPHQILTGSQPQNTAAARGSKCVNQYVCVCVYKHTHLKEYLRYNSFCKIRIIRCFSCTLIFWAPHDLRVLFKLRPQQKRRLGKSN